MFTAVLAGIATIGGVATESALADSSSGYHYVAFLRDDPGTNSVLLLNSADGGAICYDVTSLTKQGGAYTTKFVVTNGKYVDFAKFHDNHCGNRTQFDYNVFTAVSDPHKYYYLSV